MKKFLAIAVLSLFTAFTAGESMAQVRAKPNGPVLLVPRAKAAPRVQRTKPVNPKLVLIPPSAALKAAIATVPNAKALGVKVKGPLYIVKLKQGGTITQVTVHSVTGAVSRMP